MEPTRAKEERKFLLRPLSFARRQGYAGAITSMKRIIPPVLVAFCLILMAVLRSVWPVRIVIPPRANLVGIAVIAVGLAFGAAAARRFRQAKTNFDTFGEPGQLITDGPFRYSRNPMYFGMLLVLFGAWILMAAASPLIGPVLFFIAASRWYIPIEERNAQAKFGEAYEGYRQRTRRWI